jgi:predicted RNA methylase
MIAALRCLHEKFGKFSFDVQRAQCDRGRWLVGASQVVTRTVLAAALRPLDPCRKYYVDRRLGIDTRGPSRLSDRTTSSAEHTDCNPYEACPARPFLRLMKSLPLDSPAGYTFIDLGCGKGLALVLAAKYGFGRIVGVDLDPDLLESARVNVRFSGHMDAGSVELTRKDAMRYTFPSEPSVIFLFNPFGEQTMRAVARNIQQSLEEEKRPLVVAYINPVHEIVFDEIPVLRRLPDHGEKVATFVADT